MSPVSPVSPVRGMMNDTLVFLPPAIKVDE